MSEGLTACLDVSVAASTAGIPPAVARQAVEWLIELQSSESADDTRHALQQWLAQHPDHKRAWLRIEAVNGQLRIAAGSSAISSRVAHATLMEAHKATPHSAQRRCEIKKLVALLFAGGAAWVAQDNAPWREWIADERTGVGERRTVTLGDGTTVALNTSSAIEVCFTSTERRVRIVSGELLVTTSIDRAGRPFVVEAAQGDLQPLGTRFAVRQQTDSSRVDVFEGAVAIRPHDAPTVGRPMRILRAGERAHFTRKAVTEPQPVSDNTIAWTDGMLVASNMRLCDFLAELSRHRPGHLSCESTIADLRVSGSYPLADTGRILDVLRTTLPVEIHFLTRYWVMVRPAHS